jgi:hypothetical protein
MSRQLKCCLWLVKVMWNVMHIFLLMKLENTGLSWDSTFSHQWFITIKFLIIGRPHKHYDTAYASANYGCSCTALFYFCFIIIIRVDTPGDSFTNIVLQVMDLALYWISISLNSLVGSFTHWGTVFGERIICIGDTRKLRSSTIIVNVSTTRSLLKLPSSLTDLIGV